MLLSPAQIATAQAASASLRSLPWGQYCPGLEDNLLSLHREGLGRHGQLCHGAVARETCPA